MDTMPEVTQGVGGGLLKKVITSNGVPPARMMSLGQPSTSGRKKEGKKERTGGIGSIFLPNKNECTQILSFTKGLEKKQVSPMYYRIHRFHYFTILFIAKNALY